MGNCEGEDDPVFQVHQKYYEEAPSFADIIFLENVVEYKLQQTASSQLGPQWSVQALSVDPRLFGLGCARARTYGIAIKKSMHTWSKSITLTSVIEALKAQPMMKADDFFFLTKVPTMKLTDAQDT